MRTLVGALGLRGEAELWNRFVLQGRPNGIRTAKVASAPPMV